MTHYPKVIQLDSDETPADNIFCPLKTPRRLKRSVPQKLSSARFDAESFLRTLRGGTKVVEYRKKRSVFVKGVPPRFVFYVQKERGHVTITSAQRREGIVA